MGVGFGASEELWLWIHPFFYSKGQFLIYGKFPYSNIRVPRLIVWDREVPEWSNFSIIQAPYYSFRDAPPTH